MSDLPPAWDPLSWQQEPRERWTMKEREPRPAPVAESPTDIHYRLVNEDIRRSKEQNYLPEEYPRQRVDDAFLMFVGCLFLVALGALIVGIVAAVA